jgi:hypothetical protein
MVLKCTAVGKTESIWIENWGVRETAEPELSVPLLNTNICNNMFKNIENMAHKDPQQLIGIMWKL